MTTSLSNASDASAATAATAPSGFVALNLSEPVLKAIEEVGYTEPTPVQAATYPVAITGKDIIVQARTGTGKTAAFGIPLVDKLVTADPWVQALVLAPTRELAVQSQRELARLAQFKGLHTVAIYGGAPMGRQIDELKSGAQLVSGTPGRVLDHLRRGTLEPSRLKVLVLDEMDEMLSMGFAKELNAILEMLPPKGKRQTMCFSATVDGEIRRHAERHMHEPEMISLSSDAVSAAQITHQVFMVSGRDRIGDLVRVLEVEDPDSAIIFCNMRSETERVAMGLKQAGFNADWLNGDLPQKDRERIMASTREGKLRYLVATDVAARGIDISHLTHVINFTFPESAAVYVHRTGRTGRAGRTGCAISLVGPEELGRLYYLRLEYKISPHERSLPTSGELKTRAEIDRIGLLEAAFQDRPNPGDLSVARRLLTHPENERILAGLLHTFFGTKEEVDDEAAAARRSKPGPEVVEQPARPARDRERHSRERRDQDRPRFRDREGREGRDSRDRREARDGNRAGGDREARDGDRNREARNGDRNREGGDREVRDGDRNREARNRLGSDREARDGDRNREGSEARDRNREGREGDARDGDREARDRNREGGEARERSREGRGREGRDRDRNREGRDLGARDGDREARDGDRNREGAETLDRNREGGDRAGRDRNREGRDRSESRGRDRDAARGRDRDRPRRDGESPQGADAGSSQQPSSEQEQGTLPDVDAARSSDRDAARGSDRDRDAARSGGGDREAARRADRDAARSGERERTRSGERDSVGGSDRDAVGGSDRDAVGGSDRDVGGGDFEAAGNGDRDAVRGGERGSARGSERSAGRSGGERNAAGGSDRDVRSSDFAAAGDGERDVARSGDPDAARGGGRGGERGRGRERDAARGRSREAADEGERGADVAERDAGDERAAADPERGRSRERGSASSRNGVGASEVAHGDAGAQSTVAAEGSDVSTSEDAAAAKREGRRRRSRSRERSRSRAAESLPPSAADAATESNGAAEEPVARERKRSSAQATPVVAVDGELFPSEANGEENGEHVSSEQLEGLLYLNLGKRDGLRVPDVARLLRDNCELSRGQIGRIRVRDRYTFVDVPEERLDSIIASLSGQVVLDKPLAPERAKTAKN